MKIKDVILFTLCTCSIKCDRALTNHITGLRYVDGQIPRALSGVCAEGTKESSHKDWVRLRCLAQVFCCWSLVFVLDIITGMSMIKTRDKQP